MTAPSDPALDRLLKALAGLRRRHIITVVATALVSATLLGLILLSLLVSLEAQLYLSPSWRSGLLLACSGLALLLPGALVVRRIRRILPLERVALDAEAAAPQLRQRLITALQLGTATSTAASPQLLAAVVADASDALEALPSTQLVAARDLRRAGQWLGGVSLLVALFSALGGDTAAAAWHRVSHPTQAFQAPQRTHIALSAQAIELIRGDDGAVFVHFEGDVPATMHVRRHTGDGETHEEIVLPRELASGDSVRYGLDEMQHPAQLFFSAGDGRAGPLAVTIIDPPAVQRLQLAYEYPRHTQLPPRIDEEGGDIRALAGTRIGFTVHATKGLSAAAIVVDDTLRLPAEVTDATARLRWTLPTQGAAPRSYHVELLDDGGVANRQPIRYAVQILQDADPSVTIAVPGQDRDLPETQRITLEIEATDDFGISRLDLRYAINDGPEQSLTVAHDVGRQSRIQHDWDLTSFDLLPEDRVLYFAQVFDNDAGGGPKSATSQRYWLRFPSLYELYTETDVRQEGQLDELQELARQEAESRETIERLRRDVLRTEELSWEQRQELEATLAAERERTEQLEELAQAMAETMERLEESGLGTQDVLEKMDQIRNLMAAVTSPEMLEALQELQQTMDEPDPQQLADALQRFAEDQEAFQERLERTLSLLQQIRAEQHLQSAVAQAEDLQQRQETINDALSDGAAPPEQSERLAEQEASLARDTERLQEELQSLSEQFDAIRQQTAEALQEQAERMEQQQLSGRMKDMEQSLAARSSDARRKGEGLEQELARLNSALQGVQAEFDGGQRQQMSQQLLQAMAGLVDLSQRQESLVSSIDGLRGAKVADHAATQQALARGVELVVDQIGEVSQQTMALDPGLATTIGYALTRMETAALHLGQRQSTQAAEAGHSAGGYLNEAVLQLRQSVDNLQQASTPSAFGEAMERMMGLSQQQMSLNQATQQALQEGAQPGAQGQGSNSRNALPRLAAEQRRIYRALAEVERSLRGQRSMEERVQAIRKDMEGVLSQMERNSVDPSVQRGQQKVLQRMLDASRSINQRGFEKKRRGNKAEQRLYSGPEWLPADLGQRADALAEAMRRALAGDYPDEYRQLIRRYYETVYDDLHSAGQELP